MAPKTPKGGNSEQGNNDEAGRHIKVLCHLMACGDGATAELAPILGLSHAKNVPRKINSIINPYGFEFKAGKVVKKEGADTPATTAAAGAGAPATPPDGVGQESPVKAPKKRTATPKKRKLNDVQKEDEEMASGNAEV